LKAIWFLIGDDFEDDFEDEFITELFNINCWTVATALLTEQLGNSAASIPTSGLATKKATTVRADVGAAAAGSRRAYTRKRKKPQNYNFLVFW
jgi:hypothetical protein